jgi:hypothetical protein
MYTDTGLWTWSLLDMVGHEGKELLDGWTLLDMADMREKSCWTLLDIVGHCWTLLDMVGHGWTLLDMADMRENNCWTLLDIVGHCWTWLDMVGHGWTWLDMVGHGWTWLDMVGHGWTLVDMREKEPFSEGKKRQTPSCSARWPLSTLNAQPPELKHGLMTRPQGAAVS